MITKFPKGLKSRECWSVEYYSTSMKYWSQLSKYGWTLSDDEKHDINLFTLPKAMLAIERWREDDRAFQSHRSYIYRVRNIQTGQTIVV